MRFRIRNGLALGLAALLIVLGFWLGESGAPPWAATPIATALLGASLVTVVMPGRQLTKPVIGIGLLVLYAVAFWLGSLSFNQAYNECVEKGEAVRAQLSEYHKRKNQFPERLSQLEGLGLCRLVIRSSVLRYERTKDGYALSFKDWLVEHSATEAQPFQAHK